MTETKRELSEAHKRKMQKGRERKKREEEKAAEKQRREAVKNIRVILERTTRDDDKAYAAYQANKGSEKLFRRWLAVNGRLLNAVTAMRAHEARPA